VLRSLSRTASGCCSTEENALVARARAILALHNEMADLVRLGAYRPGADPAVALAPRIESVLRQSRDEQATLQDSFAQLAAALEPAP
jgi:flagellum-specific ATP synthase